MLKLSSKKGQHVPEYAPTDEIWKEKVCVVGHIGKGKGLGLQEEPAKEILPRQRSHCQTHKRQSICLQQYDNGTDCQTAGVYHIFSRPDNGEQDCRQDCLRNVRLSDRRVPQDRPPWNNECLQAIEKFSNQIQPHS